MNNKLLSLAVCGLLVVLFSSAAYAQHGVPHQFFGSVTANGVAAPDNLSVVAKIDGLEVASTTTLNSTYGLLPGDIFYIEDPNGNRYGETIEFYVSGIKAADYVFSNGDSTELDLSVTGDLGVCGDGSCGSGESCSSCSKDCGSCQTTPPGGGTYTPPSGGTYTPPCSENWTCSVWSICSQDSKQIRVCNDANNCGTEKEKPAETQTCTYTPPQVTAVCDSGTKTCVNDDLMECSEVGNWVKVETCKNGCSVDKCIISISPDAGGGTDETGTGLVGYFIDNPATLYGIIIVIIVIVAAGAYWKLRKTQKTI